MTKDNTAPHTNMTIAIPATTPTPDPDAYRFLCFTNVCYMYVLVCNCNTLVTKFTCTKSSSDQCEKERQLITCTVNDAT